MEAAPQPPLSWVGLCPRRNGGRRRSRRLRRRALTRFKSPAPCAAADGGECVCVWGGVCEGKQRDSRRGWGPAKGKARQAERSRCRRSCPGPGAGPSPTAPLRASATPPGGHRPSRVSPVPSRPPPPQLRCLLLRAPPAFPPPLGAASSRGSASTRGAGGAAASAADGRREKPRGYVPAG